MSEKIVRVNKISPVPIIQTGPSDSESMPRPQKIVILESFPSKLWSKLWSASQTQVPCDRRDTMNEFQATGNSIPLNMHCIWELDASP